MVAGAIFDMDGLLVDSESVWQKNWQFFANEMGVELPEEFKYEICGSSGEMMMDILRRYYHTDQPEELHAKCKKKTFEEIDKGVPLKEGAKEILEYFHQAGVKLAVASAAPHERIHKNLMNLGIEKYFDAVVSGADVENGKPAPDIFLKAAHELQLDPEDCYVFEDAFNGIKAAHSAGCKPIMIPDLSQPDEYIRSLCVGVFETLAKAKEEIKEKSS